MRMEDKIYQNEDKVWLRARRNLKEAERETAEKTYRTWNRFMSSGSHAQYSIFCASGQCAAGDWMMNLSNERSLIRYQWYGSTFITGYYFDGATNPTLLAGFDICHLKKSSLIIYTIWINITKIQQCKECKSLKEMSPNHMCALCILEFSLYIHYIMGQWESYLYKV